MNVVIRFITLSFFLASALFPTKAGAQFFALGQNPANLKWNQIQTENFQIIFPEGLDDYAQKAANTLEHAYGHVSKTLNHKPPKISILLQNQTVVSNAFVAWAPKRSEFFTTPPANNEPIDWLDLLAIHELRHVVQIDKYRQGLTKVLSYIFGESAVISMVGLTTPPWFWEGDATGTETALTNSGRGRLPSFEMQLRSQLLTYGAYSYQKASFRSLKDFVPNHYHLGYFMTTHVKRKYGTQIWEKVINRSARMPFRPFAFSAALKRETGKSTKQMYEEVVNELDSLWNVQNEKTDIIEAEKLSQKKPKVFTNYRFPQRLEDGSIVAEKTGLGDIKQFVRFYPDGEEEKLLETGFYESVTLSVAQNKIVWAEMAFDKRWSNRTYSVIKVFDVTTKKAKTLTQKTKFFAPAFSKDATKIVTVEVNEFNQYTLVIIDAETGAELKRLPNIKNDLFLTPKWSPDGQQIITVVQNKGGKTIAMVDVASGQIKELIPYTYYNISNPTMHGNYIYHHGAYSGINNIYAIDVSNGDQFQVTSEKYGAYYPTTSSDGENLIYNDYQANGYGIVTQKVKPTEWEKLEDISNNSIRYYEPLIKQESNGSILGDIPDKTYEIKGYKKWKHLLNFHSWAPYVEVDEGRNTETQINLFSQNKLSTSFTTLDWIYNWNENVSSIAANYTYQGWYPQMSVGIEYGNRATALLDSNEVFRNHVWSEKSISAALALPLNLNKGKYIQRLTLSAQSEYTDISNKISPTDQIREGDLYTSEYKISFLRLLKASQRDMRSRWGQSLILDYKNTPFNSDRAGKLFAVRSGFYFPGGFKHHSLFLTGNYQRDNAKSYRFSSLLSLPRGYGFTPHQHLYKITANYKLPLLYPDLNIWWLTYFKRVKANLFWDYAWGEDGSTKTTYQSTGVELTTDVNLLRYFSTFDLGVRYSILTDSNESVVEFLVNLSLF